MPSAMRGRPLAGMIAVLLLTGCSGLSAGDAAAEVEEQVRLLEAENRELRDQVVQLQREMEDLQAQAASPQLLDHLPPSLRCPRLLLPPPPEVEAADWGETSVYPHLNLLVLFWDAAWNWNMRYQIPMTADSEDCIDEQIAARLRWVQSETGIDTVGTVAVLKQFVLDELGPDIILGSADVEEGERNRLTITADALTRELDGREFWRFRVVLFRNEEGWVVESARPVED